MEEYTETTKRSIRWKNILDDLSDNLPVEVTATARGNHAPSGSPDWFYEVGNDFEIEIQSYIPGAGYQEMSDAELGQKIKEYFLDYARENFEKLN